MPCTVLESLYRGMPGLADLESEELLYWGPLFASWPNVARMSRGMHPGTHISKLLKADSLSLTWVQTAQHKLWNQSTSRFTQGPGRQELGGAERICTAAASAALQLCACVARC